MISPFPDFGRKVNPIPMRGQIKPSRIFITSYGPVTRCPGRASESGEWGGQVGKYLHPQILATMEAKSSPSNDFPLLLMYVGAHPDF